jgi:S-adenosylmethionine hydrolase
MPRPIIALLTDFGLADHYAGTMKGVMLGISPDATFVDISHDVPAHDVLAAALELTASYRYFPAETVFLVVVDPDVGSSRRGLAAEASGYRFVAPDNGVLTMVLDEAVAHRAVELTDPKYARPTISRTFEGRDRFAPAAAWLAAGLELTALGGPAANLRRISMPRPSIVPSGIEGEVVRVDRFGNLITNIDRRTFDETQMGDGPFIHVAAHPVARIVSTYADAAPGELCALFGSSGHLEIAARAASAASRLGVSRGVSVRVRRPA